MFSRPLCAVQAGWMLPVPLPAGAALTPGRTLPKKAYDGKQRLPSPQMFQIKEHLPPRQHQNLNKAESEVITPITA